MSTQDRIDVMRAIDAFCEMANAHPSTPRYERGAFGPDSPGRRTVFYPDAPGAKFTRIVMADEYDNGERRARSVHAFVDNITGDLLKAAGWKAPAKGARYNLLTYFAEVERNFTWSGGYLYTSHTKV